MKDHTNCKTYLKAKTAEGLKLLMLRNNLTTSAYHDYRIIHDGQFWFAWFEYDASKEIEAEKQKVLSERIN